MENGRVNTIEEYFSSLTVEQKKVLEKLRQVIKSAVPEAQEKISYQMPYYDFHGRLAYFAAFKKHYGLYVMKHVIQHFKEKLDNRVTGAATIQFQYDEPLPEALITEIIQFGAKSNIEKVEMKKMMKRKK